MCLSTIEEQYDPPSTLIIDGWKQFTGSGKALYFENYGINNSKAVPLDQWITAFAVEISSLDYKKYTTGFHIYEEEPKNKVGYTRVFVRKVTYRGTQDSKKCLIAQEMYVPSSKNGWPPTSTETTQKNKGLMDKLKSKLPGGNA